MGQRADVKGLITSQGWAEPLRPFASLNPGFSGGNTWGRDAAVVAYLEASFPLMRKIVSLLN